MTVSSGKMGKLPSTHEQHKEQAGSRPRSRSSKRSKTGCLTCKFRKVKCDESKPECNRCQIFGVDCDGYEKNSMKPRPHPSTLINYLHPTHNFLAPDLSSTLKFENEAEQKHFRTFQSDTAWDIAGIFESHFWRKIVLQACHEEKFVLDAVLALSAYNNSLKLSRSGREDEACVTIASEQSQYALQKYQDSLQVMRQSLSSKPSRRKALIACLLVCSFEGLLGNTLTALSHAQSGQRLIDNFKADNPHPKPHEDGISSPAPHIIEDNLLQATHYFETQINGPFDWRSSEDHAKMKMEGSETILRMPKTFTDLAEARIYWDLIFRRSIHFASECSMYSFEASHLCTPDLGVSYTQTYLHPTKIPTEQLGHYQYEKQRFLGDIARWSTAFSELYSKLKRSSSKRLVIGSHTLYINSKFAEITVGLILSRTSLSHDKHDSHFCEIVNLAREIIGTKRTFSDAEFTAEFGIIPSLHMVARCCRVRSVRREAMILLNWYGIREGHWDSAKLAAIDNCLMELEEEGVSTEYIPEWARVRLVSVTLVEGQTAIEYVRGPREMGESAANKPITRTDAPNLTVCKLKVGAGVRKRDRYFECGD